MNKQQLSQLLDDKLDPITDWLATQPEGSFSIQKTTEKWSNGEHLEHLRKTTRAVNKGMKIPKLVLRWKFGVNKRDERTYEESTEIYLNKLKESNVKSPKHLTTEGVTEAGKDRIIKWFIEEKETMQHFIKKSSEAQLSKYVLPHPLVGKMSFREFVYFTAFHGEHHFKLMKHYNG